MQNSKAIVPFSTGAITITTTDGQEITLAPGNSGAGVGGSVADMIGPSGGKPLPRLIVGQPKDDRVPREWAGQFGLAVSELAVNEAGESEKVKQYLGPLGETLRARVVGYTMNRSFMPKYVAGADNKPLCHSEDFLRPDAQYMGKYSERCVTPNMQRHRLIPFCPYAKWGEKDPQTGKGQPPACNETYVLCLALPHEDEWIYAEGYFKSSSAKSGQTLISQLRSLEHKELPLYSFPIELKVADAQVGYSFNGRMLVPPPGQEDSLFPATEEEIQALEAGSMRWAAALRIREDRAAQTFDAQEDAQGSAADAMGGQTQNAATAPTAGKGGKVTKKAMI